MIPPARLLLTLIIAALLGVSLSAYSATNIVTSLADSGPGSLREIIAASASGDEVRFNVGGTILLINGELKIAENLTIRGPGSETLAISGNHLSRVFWITNGAVVAISGLSIINGRPAQLDWPGGGGGILNHGELTVSNCTISGNFSVEVGSTGGSIRWGRNGGGILNTGGLCLLNSSLVSNSTGREWSQEYGYANGGSGGGLFNSGTCLVSGSRFESNFTAGGAYGANGWSSPGGYGGEDGAAGGNGGAICSQTAIELVNCMLRGNGCGPGGNGGAAFMLGRTGGPGGKGGAIYANGELTMTGCTIASNAAGDGGNGGLSIHNEPYPGYGGLGGDGGGICGPSPAGSGALWITNCTFAYNCSGNAGIGHEGAPAGSGGAAYACWSNHAIISCTIVSNSIGVSSASGGTGGGIFFDALTRPVLLNVIVAQNHGPWFYLVDPGPDIVGLVTSLGHNLIGATNGTGGFTLPGDRVGSYDLPLDPKVGPLGDHGGPTWTMALLAGSPAIDAGDDTLANSTDQRGFPRMAGLHVDIGACEFGSALPAIPLSITNCTFDAPHRVFSFCILGGAGLTAVVETCTNLGAPIWLPVVTNQLDGSVSNFSTTNLPAENQRFYRLHVP